MYKIYSVLPVFCLKFLGVFRPVPDMLLKGRNLNKHVKKKKSSLAIVYIMFFLLISAVDPDPYWIRIHELSGSGSVFRIRIHTCIG